MLLEPLIRLFDEYAQARALRQAYCAHAGEIEEICGEIVRAEDICGEAVSISSKLRGTEIPFYLTLYDARIAELSYGTRTPWAKQAFAEIVLREQSKVISFDAKGDIRVFIPGIPVLQKEDARIVLAQDPRLLEIATKISTDVKCREFTDNVFEG